MLVITDEEIKALRERNEARARAAVAAMGTRYLCHPANRVQHQAAPNLLDVSTVQRMLSNWMGASV